MTKLSVVLSIIVVTTTFNALAQDCKNQPPGYYQARDANRAEEAAKERASKAREAAIASAPNRYSLVTTLKETSDDVYTVTGSIQLGGSTVCKFTVPNLVADEDAAPVTTCPSYPNLHIAIIDPYQDPVTAVATVDHEEYGTITIKRYPLSIDRLKSDTGTPGFAPSWPAVD